MRTAVLTFLACTVAVSVVLGQAIKKPMPSLVALVTDTQGQATTVTDLKARYFPEGGTGGRDELSTDLPALILRLVTREGRVTTTDMLNIPFATVRRLAFPGEFKIEIERRDGTRLVLRQLTKPDWTFDQQRVLEESTATGVLTKSQKMYDYDLATEKQDGTVLNARVVRVMVLHAFIGLGMTSGGREGEFGISKQEVRSIEFK